MAAEKYITQYCTISQAKANLNGQQVFDGGGLPLSDFLAAVYKHLQPGYAKFYKMDNLSKLGWLAAEFLLSGADKGYYHAEQVGTVLTNANASLDMDLRYYDSMNDEPSPSLFVYTLPNIVAGEICIRHNFKGENAFFVQSEFDANFIKQQAGYLLNNNILQACICGWVDVLGQDYHATLFMVEKVKKENSLMFNTENMSQIFNLNTLAK